MVKFSIVALALALSTVSAAPVHLEKRIAQVISDSTTLWEQACLAAGGADKCNPLSITAFTTLLAAAGPCDQQNAADSMIDLAKSLNNNADMIKFTQIFVQQPRNSPNSVSVPYCQQAPKNSELNGLFQCQFKGDNPTTFVGNIQVGQPGTIPFGHSAILSPPGSCAASPSGPIADGTQLTDTTQNPGVAGGSGGSANANSPPPASASSPPAAAASAPPQCSPPPPAANTASGSGSGASAGGSGGSNFALQNGKDAQKLNAQFATLSASSSCTEGQNACVNGGFAQCVGGKFAITQCAATTTCAALPLVNSPGTSITCTTPADATSRIAATGATGGITGSG
jgi:hypothetical protein